jgi:hypothetical protein
VGAGSFRLLEIVGPMGLHGWWIANMAAMLESHKSRQQMSPKSISDKRQRHKGGLWDPQFRWSIHHLLR